MTNVLCYGTETDISLDLDARVLVAQCGRPTREPIDEPIEAVSRAMATLIEYPSLAQCVTRGDRVVLAVEEGLPRADQIVAGTIQAFLGAGVEADGIGVLRTASDVADNVGDPRQYLPTNVGERISLPVHDPTDRSKLAYLAANDRGDPILLSRAVIDADMVVPVGCFRNPLAPGCHGVFGAIYPTFSDTRSMRRFQSATALNAAGRPKRQVVEAVDRVGWLLGVRLVVQVVPGAGRGDQILDVLAGEATAVQQRGTELYRDAWGETVPHRASLVIAGIEGDSRHQTWQNLGRALAVASELVEIDGAIVLCTDLQGPLPAALRQLAEADSRDEALRAIRKQRPDGAQPAAQLARTLDLARVYLLSRLAPSDVEDLQMALLTDPADISRLAHRHPTCILLSNAQSSMATCQHCDSVSSM